MNYLSITGVAIELYFMQCSRLRSSTIVHSSSDDDDDGGDDGFCVVMPLPA